MPLWAFSYTPYRHCYFSQCRKLLFSSVNACRYRESDIENWYFNYTDLYWWGELLNLIPSFGYAGSLTYVLLVTLSVGFDPSSDIPQIHEALRVQTAINTACDAFWFIDSIIYLVAWIRGVTKLLGRKERKIGEIPVTLVTETQPDQVILIETVKSKKKRKPKSLATMVTLPHYTFREAPMHHRGYFKPQKKKKQPKKIVSNKRAKSKQKSKHKSHLPV